MKRKRYLTAILPLLLLVLTLGGMTTRAGAEGPPTDQFTVQKNGSDQVETRRGFDAFEAALQEGNATITMVPNGLITLQVGNEPSGRMQPLEIGANTTVIGSGGSMISSRCPIQLAGDNVKFRNLLLFMESGTLTENSQAHREIFLAGHSLTLDGVSTWDDNKGGSSFGAEKKLLPTVYAGGYPYSDPSGKPALGNHAQLTVVNAVKEHTDFQDIFMAHSQHYGTATRYTGEATLTLGPGVRVKDGIREDGTIPSGIYTRDHLFEQAREPEKPAENSKATVIFQSGSAGKIAGEAQLNAGAGTTVQLQGATLNPTLQLLGSPGAIVLDGSSELNINQETAAGSLTLPEGSILSMQKGGTLTLSGDFDGGGKLIIQDAGTHLTVRGEVRGETDVQASSIQPGTHLITTPETAADTAFRLLDVDGQPHTTQALVKNGTNWTMENITEPVSEIQVSPKSLELDLSKPEQAPPVTVEFYTAKGKLTGQALKDRTDLIDANILQTAAVVKKEYWDMTEEQAQAHEYDQLALWGSDIRLVASGLNDDRYTLTLPEKRPEEGDYVLLISDYPLEIAEDQIYFNVYETIKHLSDVRTEIPLHITDSSVIPAGELEIQPIPDQFHTGSVITPPLTVKVGGVTLGPQDYQAEYSRNQNPGQAVVKVTGLGSYAGKTAETSFNIVKLGLTASNLTYGKVEFKVSAEGRGSESRQIALYLGEKKLVGGALSEYSPNPSLRPERASDLPAGVPVTVSLWYGESTDSLRDSGVSLTVTLAKQEIRIANLSAKFTEAMIPYNEERRAEIPVVTSDVHYPAPKLRGAVILPENVQQGLYELPLASLELVGEDDNRYVLEDVQGKSIRISYPYISVVPGTYPPQHITVEGRPGQAVTVDLKDHLPAGALRADTAYQPAAGQVSDGVLTWTPGTAGETVTVTVNSRNYEPITLTVELTEKAEPRLTLTAAERTETGVELTCGLPAVPEKGSGVLMAAAYSDKGQLIALIQQEADLTRTSTVSLTMKGEGIGKVAVFLTDGKSRAPLTGKAEQTLQTVP